VASQVATGLRTHANLTGLSTPGKTKAGRRPL